MRQNLLRTFGLAGLLIIVFSAVAMAQDYTRTYTLPSEGVISVKSISGDVKVTGYEGEVVSVKAYKEGRDRDKVEVLDKSSSNRVDLSVSYPDHCNCDASIRFEVLVPVTTKYKFESISSISGNVTVDGAVGYLRAHSVSGNVNVKTVTGIVDAASTSGDVHVGEISGTVNAKSVSGDVIVAINQLAGAQGMDFSSTSGNVNVKLPGNLDANVEMSVLSGDLKTDFPLTIEKREHGPGQRASGVVGGGSRKLTLKSISGNVELRRL